MGPMFPCTDPRCSFCSVVFASREPRVVVGSCRHGGCFPSGQPRYEPRGEPRMPPPSRTYPAPSGAYPAPPASASADLKETFALVTPFAQVIASAFFGDRRRKDLSNAAIEQEALAGARLAEAAHWAIVVAKNGVATDAWAAPLAEAIDNFATAQETRVAIDSGDGAPVEIAADAAPEEPAEPAEPAPSPPPTPDSKDIS